jgi:hypothetical protein
MSDGFLGNGASFMLDFVVCALVVLVPLLIYSVYVVKVKRNYTKHRNLQLALGAVLLVAVAAFEIDLQIVHQGWENIVAKRRPPLSADEFAFVQKVLWVHLIFAVSTPVLWLATTALALRRFPNPPMPAAHSELHIKLGWLSAVDLTLTSATGIAFYYFAFIG